MPKRRWTDQQLRDAIATSTTWSNVYRCLGLRGPSGAVRRRCEELGISHAHVGDPVGRRRWTDEELVAAVADSANMRQVFLALGLAVGGGTWMSMQDHIRRLGLDTSHWERPVSPQRIPRAQRQRYDWSDEEVRRACRGATSVAQVMAKLGLDPRRKRGRSAVERRMRGVGVEPEDLPGQGWAKGMATPRQYRKPLSDILVTGRTIASTSQLKQRLVAEGVFVWRCAVCSIAEWRGRHLVLQLDHINGDRRDNRVENLRLLCPNCHSQTDTFAGRNAGKGYSSPR